MDFTAETPRNERTIAGLKLSVIAPFAEGQSLTPATAAMLNQTLAENFSNNLRKAIGDGKLDANGKPTGTAFTIEEAQKLVDEYMSIYQPGVRASGSGEPRVTDPIEREARKIAKIKAKEHVAANNMKEKDVDMADLTSLIFDKYRDQLMAAGKKVHEANLKAQQSATIDLGDVAVKEKAVVEAAPEPTA